jgi:type I restriction enzyme S subunit
MALCDEFEVARAEQERCTDRLSVASLGQLTSPKVQSPTVIAGVLEHVPRFLTRIEHLPVVRESILSLALEGRLVHQDARDSAVDEMLSQSDAVRAVVARDDRRADVKQQDLLSEDRRWAIPSTWAWRGLADLVLFIDYRGKTPDKKEAGVPLITAKNVRPGFINPEPREFVSEEEFERWMTRGLPRSGDVLFTTEAPMGNASVIRSEERFALAQRVIDFRSYGALDPGFLVLQLLCPQFQLILSLTATGLTAKGIKAAKLKRLPIAIPPLAEQHRIVDKVAELMVVCDELEQRLITAQTRRARALDAVLTDALAEGAEGLEPSAR